MLQLLEATTPHERPPAATPPAPGRSTSALHRSVALVVGAVLAGSVVALRASGALEGTLALVAAVLLALAVPTSRHLPRRVLLLAALAAGALPALWWLPLPVGSTGRATVLLALLTGSTGAALLWEGPRAVPRRAGAAMPRWHRVDLVVAAAAGAGAWVASAWLRLPSARAALSALLPAWDSSAHLDMVLMVRRHGATIGALGPAAADEHWKFTEYPQGYHAIVATAVELLNGAGPGRLTGDLVAYAHVQGWVVVALSTVLAAGVCALPSARRRPARALVLSTFVAAAFVVGPGSAAIRDGFVNFTVACAFAACTVLLASSLPPRPRLLHVVALASLVVGVAQTWVLLLCVALPAAALAVLPLRRHAWTGRRAWLVAAAGAVVALVGLAQTGRTLLGLVPGKVLVIPGAITTADPGVLVAVVAAALALTLGARGHQRSRTSWAAVVPVAGGLAVLAVAAVQLHGGGGLSYYFWKLLTGVALTCTAVVAVALLRRPDAVTPTTWSQRVRLAVAVPLACLAASQVFGFTGLGRHALPAPQDHVEAADQLLHAADAVAPLGPGRATYLAVDGIHPVNAQQWLLALTGRWTVEANDSAGTMLGDDGQPRAAAESAAILLGTDDAVVVVSPQDREVLLSEPAIAAHADRVLTW